MKVAVLGFGTVGSGVVEVLQVNTESIKKKIGESLELKYILDIRDFSNHQDHEKFVTSIDPILEDDEVKIVAEAMGGIEPAYSYIKALLAKGKSVVTSNKELVALHGPELIALAKSQGCNFLFEASVGGGIPIIRPLNHALTADEIYEITGILNGTTNFILTKMRDEGRTFEDVLKEAQALGYAERNPEADVEGHDACRKIAILSSLAFGHHVDYKEVETKGITQITSEDMKYAAALGRCIKLLGRCIKQGEKVFVSVEPTMISNSHPLAMVNDVFNAVFVKGNMVGDVMFYGRGAGKLPTASAVVADMIEAARHKGVSITTFWSREKVELSPKSECEASYFIRLEGEKLYLQTLVKEVFAEVEEIEALNDKEYAFITAKDKISSIMDRLNHLKGTRVISCIAVER